MSNRRIPHKPNPKYTKAPFKISAERKDQLKQLARKMISYVVTATIEPTAMMAIKKLSAVASWCSPETNIIKQGVYNACKNANWALILDEVANGESVYTLEMNTLQKFVNDEIAEQIKIWHDVDAIMVQVSELETSDDEHYTFLEEAGNIINKVENEEASKGNPAILGIIAGYCPKMPKDRMQYFASALESAFLTYQKITS